MNFVTMASKKKVKISHLNAEYDAVPGAVCKTYSTKN